MVLNLGYLFELFLFFRSFDWFRSVSHHVIEPQVLDTLAFSSSKRTHRNLFKVASVRDLSTFIDILNIWQILSKIIIRPSIQESGIY